VNVLHFSQHQPRKQFLTSSRDTSSQWATTVRQPLLFRTQRWCFVLGDRTSIPVTDASCFTEAVEFLFFMFFVFNVQYTQQTEILLLTGTEDF